MKQFDPKTLLHTSTHTSMQDIYNKDSKDNEENKDYKEMPASKKAAQKGLGTTSPLRYARDHLARAREELLYGVLDLTREASAFAELSQIFARHGLALMAEHALQKASGRLAYATALLDLADEVAGPAAPATFATAP